MCILVSSSKYRVDDFGEIIAQDSAEERQFKSREDKDHEETDSRDPDHHPL